MDIHCLYKGRVSAIDLQARYTNYRTKNLYLLLYRRSNKMVLVVLSGLTTPRSDWVYMFQIKLHLKV